MAITTLRRPRLQRPLYQALGGMVLLVVVAVVVALLPPFEQFIAAQVAALAIIVMGLNLLMGVAGLLSLASAAFVGVGATVLASLMVNRGANVLVALAAALVIGAALGWVLAAVSLRLSGFYLAIVTLGFLDAFVSVIQSSGDWGGGGYGLFVPPITMPGYGEVPLETVYVAAGVAAVVVGLLIRNVVQGRIGRAWLATKDRPEVAELCGINLATSRTAAFTLSSAVTAFGGAIQAILLASTSPSSYGASVTVEHLSYAVVGGVGPSVLGPFIGPSLLFGLPEVGLDLGEYQALAYGCGLLLVLAVAPVGVRGLGDVVIRKGVRTWARQK